MLMRNGRPIHILVIGRANAGCGQARLRFQKVSSLERLGRNGLPTEDMLTLRAIEEDRLEAAAKLLAEGFPSRSHAFWQRGLARLSVHNKSMGQCSVGTFLMANERPVGILLTIPKFDTLTGRRVVNLSSWYVEEAHRWSAARLIMAALADKEAVYTDLTPTKAAAAVNARFGFRSFPTKMLLLALPWTMFVGRRRGRLVPLDDVPSGAISPALMPDLKAHSDLGCIVTTVEAEACYHPVVFDVAMRMRIPVARLVFAENMGLVMDNLGGLARLLVRRGVPLMALQVDENMHIPHAWTWKRDLCYQVRGEWDARMINELYCERVLLKV